MIISVFCGNCVVFRIIVNLEIDTCTFNRFAFGVNNFDIQFGCRGIVFNNIDFCIVGISVDNFLGAVVIAENTSVH